MDAVEPARVEVHAWLAKLNSPTEQVIGSEVVIEATQERRQQRLYRVSMDMTLADGVVRVTLEHPSNVPHEDLYVAIRNAFRAARRQLEEHSRARSTPAAVTAEPSREVSEGT